jgi:hypothetical protein
MNRYSISFIVETIVRLSKAKWMIKIDIRHAFNRIRMHFRKNEDLITFRIKYETYKYLIMFFELINESSTFQNFMNDILMSYLNEFVIAYLNDIIVYSNSKKEHIRHVRKILQRLREANIQTNVDKCEFHTIETKFLRMIIDRDDIKMNLEKIKAIVEWNTSNHLKKRSSVSEIRQFLQTLHKEFFQNRQIVDKNDKKESIVLLIRKLSNSVRAIEKTNHRSVCSIVFFIRIEDVSRIKPVRLRVNRDFISKRRWWSYQINNLLF